MEKLFMEIINKAYTFEELHRGALNEIPEKSGVYFVIMPECFKLVIKEKSDGFQLTCKGKQAAFPIYKLNKKINHYGREEKYSNNILYIGKAEDLHSRIEQYVGCRYNVPKLCPHDGGRAIWQLENNEKLLVQYMECQNGEDCRTLEHRLLLAYKEKYGAYPFANWQS
jgi:hypothetical protein